MAIIETDVQKVFNEACSYCDWDDKETLAAIRSIKEADQENITYAVAEKLYDLVSAKANISKMDFSEIIRTKGDITKLPEYDTLTDTLKVLKDAKSRLHLRGKAIDVAYTGLDNLTKKRNTFMSAFRTGNAVLTDTYKFGCMAVVATTSLIAISLTDYFTNQDVSKVDTKEYEMLDSNPLIYNLERFNKLCASGGLEKVEKALAKVKRSNIGGATIAASIGVAVVIIYNLVDILRELIYYFLFTKASISEYFYANSLALEINSNKIKADNKDAAETQQSFADSFRKIAAKLKVDDKETVYKAAKEMKKDKTNTKLVAGELGDSLPDASAADSSGLF